MTGLLAALAAGGAAWSGGPVGRASTARAGLGTPRLAGPLLLVAAVIAAAIASWLLRLPLAVLAVSAGGAVVALLRASRSRSHRRRAALDADVLTFCFAVAAEVRTGRLPSEAVAATLPQLGPLALRMSAVARAAAHGAPVDGELRALADLLASPRLDTVAAVWAATSVTGSRIADVLERVALAFKAEDEARSDLDALAAGPRATAMVLCLLPLAGVVLATAMGAHPLALLLHTALGVLLLFAAAVLDGCGLLWVRTVTRQALRG